jgi:hypothetical protein
MVINRLRLHGEVWVESALRAFTMCFENGHYAINPTLRTCYIHIYIVQIVLIAFNAKIVYMHIDQPQENIVHYSLCPANRVHFDFFRSNCFIFD